MLKQVEHILPTASLKILYHSMIQPHVTYGLLAWENANQCDMKNISLDACINNEGGGLPVPLYTGTNEHTPRLSSHCIVFVRQFSCT